MVDAPAAQSPAAPERPAVAMPEPDAGPALPTELLGWTLAQLTDRFGSVVGLQDWLSARKAVAELERLESRNARDAGLLISKQLVHTNIFGSLGAMADRMMRDMARKLAHTVPSAVRSGASQEQIERMLSEAVGLEIAEAKRRTISGLIGARCGDNPPELAKQTHRARPPQTPPVVDAIRTSIEIEAAPLVVDHVVKAVARSVPIEEATRLVRSILVAHVDSAVREQRAKEMPSDDDRS